MDGVTESLGHQDIRQQAIEAVADLTPHFHATVNGLPIDCAVCRSAAAVVDAVEPIIRADEFEKAYEDVISRTRLAHKNLRAQVEALTVFDPFGGGLIDKADVLALLGGDPNG